MRRKLLRISSVSILLVYFLAYFFRLVSLPHISVFAADLTEASVRLSRMDVSAASSGTDPILVVAKPATTATEASLQVTFGSGFTVDGTPANVTVSTSSLPSTYQGESLSSWPGVGSAATAVSSQIVTIASSDLTPGTLYGFYITGGVTNPGTSGQKEITITTRTSAPAAIDTKTVAVDIVENDTDQVSVTASVPASFNFALGSNDITLGDLSTSTTVNDNVVIDIDTNAGNGWVAWTRSSNTYLGSASTSDQINTQGSIDGSPTAYGAGNEHYQLDADVTNGTGAGTPAAAAEYTGTGGSGGTLSTTYQEIATSTGPGDNDGITYTIYAAASATNEAADDYIDTLTIVGAGNF